MVLMTGEHRGGVNRLIKVKDGRPLLPERTCSVDRHHVAGVSIRSSCVREHGGYVRGYCGEGLLW